MKRSRRVFLMGAGAAGLSTMAGHGSGDALAAAGGTQYATLLELEKCIGCGACAGVCPVGAIALQDDGKAGVDEGTCIDCGACVSTCPVSAISQ